MRQRVGYWWFVLVVAVVSAVAARPAWSQGLPMLPDPIDTEELMAYADILELPGQQRLSLEPFHDQYLERFGQLRAREIQRFQDDLLTIGMTFRPGSFEFPQRSAIEQLISQYDTILSRVDAVDSGLFNDMSSVLSESQIVALQRVRIRRQIAVRGFLPMLMGAEFNPGAGIELYELVDELDDLSVEERAHVQGIMQSYEVNRLDQMRDLGRVLEAAVMTTLDTIDQFGLREMSIEELMTWGQEPANIDTLRAIYDEESRPFQRTIYGQSQTNFQTMRRLLSGLGPEAARELHQRYYEEAYGRYRVGVRKWWPRYERVLDLENLTSEQREQITALRSTYDRQDRQLIERIGDAIEDSRKYRSSLDMEDEDELELVIKAREMVDARRELSDRAIAALDALLGPELVATLDGSVVGETVARAEVVEAVAAADQEVAAQEIVHEVIEVARGDETIPDPMSLKQLREFGVVLGLDEQTNLFVVETMHEDYLDAYNAVIERFDGSESADRDARRAALGAVDRSVLDDVAILGVHSERAARVQALRARACERERLTAGARWAVSERAYVDIVQVLIDADLLLTDAPASMTTILDRYDADVIGAISEAADLAAAMKRRSQMIEEMKKRGNVPDGAEERWRETWVELGEVQESLRSRTNDTVQQLLATMNDDQAWTLRYEYNMVAYPEIFGQSSAIEEAFAEALKRSDLSSSQRDRVVTIASDFRTAFFDVSDQMVRIRELNGEWWRRGAPERENIEREIEMERLEFERDELMARARVRLELTLP